MAHVNQVEVVDAQGKTVRPISAVFRERGVELVVVGGSAIEFYTEGAYVSGDLDMCVATSRESLTIRIRQQTMGALGAIGGPRRWQVAGVFADVLGAFENLARSTIRHLAGPSGDVCIAPVEELIVERILIGRIRALPPARGLEAASAFDGYWRNMTDGLSNDEAT